MKVKKRTSFKVTLTEQEMRVIAFLTGKTSAMEFKEKRGHGSDYGVAEGDYEGALYDLFLAARTAIGE